ncbi:MAG: PhoH family protein [Deltaproteobacteria bacterium]|nr:PhoH family protein [Deltaproteobacteria bacterium]MBT4644796.1 PhoH family protein [Deltaproteobacteria bacterium]MBT6502304.1 PhoH family protein [Deltaproteobacteria bacterium]MBT7155033.1 PhoH family protein [Deltaproteobacteria bacterium]MBT7710833.1 PhoH family protein [Deltaproteobacteria bacterium]
MAAKKKKIFVLDTNVILHDPSCIDNFSNHDIIIPITVIEELDSFKKGNETINYHAREFARTLDSFSEKKPFDGGFKIGPRKGRIYIKLDKKFHPDLIDSFSKDKQDHHILNIAYHAIDEYPDKSIMVVTKDVNLRMKAKSVGLPAIDYLTDHVKDISTLYKGRRIEENVPDDVINALYQDPHQVDTSFLNDRNNLKSHEYLILKGNKKSALGTIDPVTRNIRQVNKFSAYGIKPRNAEQTFALDALTNQDVKLVSIAGKAGTGKTLLALAAGLETRKAYRQIYMARPIVPLSNKDLGYLPGDIKSKLDPYMQPLYDNLGVIQNQFGETAAKHTDIKRFLDEEKLVISPLAYIRGRSLVRVFFIVDEAQNLTPHEIKTIITRAGEGTKMIFTGDIFQIDHPYLDSQSNGLSYLIERMQGQDIYAHINLEKGERSELAEIASNLL